MSRQQDIFQLIKDLAGQKNIIAVPRLFIDLMGSVEGGLFLSQALYWSDRTTNQQNWFWKTYHEWYHETRLTKYQVKKLATKCERYGFLKTKVKKANGNPTLHYKILEEPFKQWLVKNLTFHSEVFSLSSNRDYIPASIQAYHNSQNQAQDSSTRTDVTIAGLTWTEDHQEH